MSFSTKLISMILVLLISTFVANAYYVNPDYFYGDQIPTMKKSGQLRALAGSRNCFFSPVNCIITHDIKSYRKLAGGSA
ncbi:unnamed protein product [Caenorhabditis angaria]|uniref:Uncharacterized protein n=1 Tax=Caenorhabditis angaria TaxID=860376 RepID=A0A9P1I8L5_9PELO|nr:unnamed protein product [Caenorhabditis angaria]